MLSSCKWIAAALTALAVLTALPGSASAQGGLAAEYYTHTDVVSAIDRNELFAPANLKVTRIDRDVNFNWGVGGPDPAVGTDNFGSRWVGQIKFPTAGDYEINIRSDDGARVWIQETAIDPNADVPIIDQWVDRGAGDPTTPALFTATANGTYNILVEHFENGGDAAALLEWMKPGDTGREPIPSASLIPPAAELAKYGTINGKVVDDSGRGVGGVEVVATVGAARYPGITGPDGAYSILATAGAATLALTDASLKGNTQQATVTAGQAVGAPDITLEVVAPLNLVKEGGFQWKVYISSDIAPEADYSGTTLSAEDEALFVNWDVTSGNGNWTPIVEAAEGTNPTSIDAWARLRFTVPMEWKTKFPGNPLTLYGFTVNAADETFLNGTLIGEMGKLRKDGSTQRSDAIREYTVPASLVKYGEENVIAVHGWHDGGTGGFTGGRPKLAVQLTPPLPRVRLIKENGYQWSVYISSEIQPEEDYSAATLSATDAAKFENWDVTDADGNWTPLLEAREPNGNMDAWARLTFTVPEVWKTRHKGPIRLTGFTVNAADETFVNGTRIGKSGMLIKDGTPVRVDAIRDYEIPENLVNWDGENVIAVHAWHDSGTGGFTGGRPELVATVDTLFPTLPKRKLIQENGHQWKVYISSDIAPEADYSGTTLSAEDEALFVNWDVTSGNGNWTPIVEAAEGTNPTSIDAWARLRFTLPADWKDKYYGPFRLAGFTVNAADETFVNGTLVGKSGRLLKDPEGTQRSDAVRDYEIPADLVNWTGENVIAVHGWHDGGTGGFTGGRPELQATTFGSINPSPGCKGNADSSNASIDVSDAVAILRHVVGIDALTGQALANADVNGDSSVDVGDAVLVLQAVVGLPVTQIPSITCP